MTDSTEPRIQPGGFRELGPINWAFCKLAGRLMGVPQVHLFTTLGQHKRPLGLVLLQVRVGVELECNVAARGRIASIHGWAFLQGNAGR